MDRWTGRYDGAFPTLADFYFYFILFLLFLFCVGYTFEGSEGLFLLGVFQHDCY